MQVRRLKRHLKEIIEIHFFESPLRSKAKETMLRAERPAVPNARAGTGAARERGLPGLAGPGSALIAKHLIVWVQANLYLYLPKRRRTVKIPLSIPTSDPVSPAPHPSKPHLRSGGFQRFRLRCAG